MNILNPLNELVTRKPLVAVSAIVIVTIMMLGMSIAKPQDPGMDDKAWLPDHETLAALEDIEESFPSQTSNVVILHHATTPGNQSNVLTSSFIQAKNK